VLLDVLTGCGGKMRKLLVVCHPDDEIIFAGALLLRENDWKVLCLTHADSRRGVDFRRCMASLGVEAKMASLADSVDGFPDYGGLLALLRTADLAAYDRVLTHGLRGEYGHRQHREASLAIHGLRANVECFSYRPGRRLRPEVVARKRELLAQFYGDRRVGYLRDWIECETSADSGCDAARRDVDAIAANPESRALSPSGWLRRLIERRAS
jgi:hypothetical protein